MTHKPVLAVGDGGRVAATKTSWKIWLILITALGLAVRTGVFVGFGDSFMTRGSSSTTYDALARHILEGRGFTLDGRYPEIYMFPGYAYFLAGVYATIGNSALAVATVHTILTALTGVCVFLAGWKIVDVRVGLIACLLVNLFPWLALMTMALTDGALIAFLMSLSFLLACLMLQSSRWCWVVGGGVVTGLAILVRSSVQVFFPLVVIWLFWKYGARQWRRAAVYVLLVVAVVAPWMMRNWRVCGRFISLSVAPNYLLWAGNNPQTATYIRESLSFDMLEAPDKPATTDPPEVIEAYLLNRAEAIRYMRAHPWDTALLTARKFFLFYSWSYWPRKMPGPEPGGEDVPHLHLHSLVYAWSVRPLLVLALAGVVIGWAKHKELSLLTTFLVVLGFGHAMLHAMPRFRVPFDPLLAILAAYAIIWIWDRRGKAACAAVSQFVLRSLGVGRKQPEDCPPVALWGGTA